MDTEILDPQNPPSWSKYSCRALDNLACMADDALMVTLLVITLGRRNLQVNEGAG